MLDKRSIFFCYAVVLISVINVETTEHKRSSYDTYAAPENGTCYKRVPYDEAVIANLSQGLIKTESTTPPPGVQTWITIVDCCDGYRRDEYGDCAFICEEGCGGGNCTGPNECTCEEGWQAVRGDCKPVCRQRCPQNSYCFSPDECACLFGFEEIDGICRPICEHNCRNGDCVAPTDCRCHRGYFLNETRHCEPICESGCQHGFCAAPGVCSCDQGYVNEQYDAESCIPECPAECVNGECVTPNVCTCKEGYQKNDNGTCEAQCKESCPENGMCIAPDQCGCNTGFILDIQGKTCVKLPKNAQNYPNRGGFPSRNNQGQIYNQQPKQTYGVNNVYNTQNNRPYGNGQRPTYGRNNYYNGQEGGYQTENTYGYGRTENPKKVIGLQDQVTTPNPRESTYGTYGYNQTPRPHRPYPQEGFYITTTPNPTSNTRGRFGSSTTYRPPVNDPRYTTSSPFAPLDPYPTQIPTQESNGIKNPGQPQYNYGNRGNQPTNSSIQGPFGSRFPQRFHTTQSPIQTDDPRGTVGPYGSYDSHTQSPWNNQNRNPLDRADPNGQRVPNNYPNQDTTPRDQEGITTGQRRPPYQPQLPYSPHRPYNPYAPVSPHETQGVKTSYGRPTYGPDQIYNPYAPNTPYNPRIPQQGANPHGTQGAQRPTSDIYSRSSVMQSNPHSGVSYSYGINHLNQVPQNGRPFNGQQSSTFSEPFIVPDPYAQLQPLCNGPCINSHCIGLNLCMCEIGFIPDPRNPGGNACVPI